MKIYIAIIILLLLSSCQENKKIVKQENTVYPFFIGTYTNTDSRGIYKYLLQKDGTLKQVGLVAASNNPSFLTKSTNKKFLVAVNEIDDKGEGTVESFLITDDSLEFISQSSSGGAHPCFVAVNESGFVLTANYTGGNVGLLKLNNKGELSTLLNVQQHTGSCITKQQQAPHAHSVWLNPIDNNVISIDLGTNELWFSYLDTSQQKLLPSNPLKLKMNPGAGPRHLAFHPNNKWIYVVNEIDCTVTLIHKSVDGKYKKGVSVSTLPTNYSEPNTCADIHISKDGKYVYASNRGCNTIAIFRVNEKNGLLTIIGQQPTQGDGPRNFSLSPDDKYLLVANQHTNNIVSFKRDSTSGLLKFVDQIEAPIPVCILF